MAIYTSNTSRVTGLSGIDTESMVDKLMKAESAKLNRLEKQKTSVTWKQEAFRQLISSIDNFKNKWLNATNPANNIGYNAFWNNYKNSIVDKATGQASNAITINGTSANGRYEIEIKQKAETESITGNSVSTNITTDKNITDIEQSIRQNGSISLSFNLDGSKKTIDISSNELENGKPLNELLQEKLNTAFGNTNEGEPKITVNNDGGKLVFKATGQGHSLTVGDGNARTEGVSVSSSGTLESMNGSFSMKIGEYTVTADLSGKDGKNLTNSEKLKKIQEALKTAKKDGAGEKDTTDISSKVSLSEKDGKLVISNTSKTEELKVKIGNDAEATLKATGSAHLLGMKNNTTQVKLNSKLSDIFGEEFNSFFKNADEFTLKFGGKDVTINKNDTIQSLMNKVNSSGGDVNLKFNEVTNRFTLESKQSGASGNINITDENTTNFLQKITGLDVKNKESNEKYVKGQDAIFSVDGIETTRPSNDVEMNGIKFTINTTGTVVLDSSTDVDETVKKVKEFVEDYNKLIDELNSSLTETRPKSGKYEYYDPLTDDEKKAMSEDEIKKYEEQAKKGLLNRDENISRFLSSLRDNIYKSVDIGGKSISLYEIGITTTQDYNDGGKLALDEEKLKKALQERGDEVRQLFTSENGIAAEIKKDIDNATASRGYLRQKAGIKGTTSAINNDLTKELEDITVRLAAERERLFNKENYYFNLFAKMEAAMNKQNSQMGVLLSSLGGGQ